MQPFLKRKTTPKVRGGKPLRKNRTALSPHYRHLAPDRPVIDRQRPGLGYRHLILKRDVKRFIAMLPEWDEISRGLRAIVLAAGDPDCMGWHRPGMVAVCAWDRVLSGEWCSRFVEAHRAILERLEVPVRRLAHETCRVEWTERSARGFQLVHVLLHELGHHHDRMTTRSKWRASRGEPYAESYANEHAERLWERYFDAFGW